MNKVSIVDRLISIAAYLTFGIASLVWIIFANIKKIRIGQFLSFNLYQAIFLSVILSAVTLFYDIVIDFTSELPFIGKLAFKFDILINHTPFFSLTLSGLCVSVLILYLCLFSFLGIKARIPFISNIIETNFGG